MCRRSMQSKIMTQWIFFVLFRRYCVRLRYVIKSMLFLLSVWNSSLERCRRQGKNIITFSTKQQFAIWDTTTHVKISALHNKFTALFTAFRYANGSMRFGTQLLFTQRWQRVWPANPTSFFPVQLLLLTGEARGGGDTIVALIDWVNKYSVLVPVRCSLPCNTPSVCCSLQSNTVTSCLPRRALLN